MAPSDSPRLSEKAQSGFANAALYDVHRPSYPPEAVSTLLSAAAVDGVHGARLVDLAAGTGKFTELLAQREESFSILAVEPHLQMREQLANKTLDNVTVADGLSTAIPAEDETIDAVFAAQVRRGFRIPCAWEPAVWSSQRFVERAVSPAASGAMWEPPHQPVVLKTSCSVDIIW
jgi:hypothetical protein